ncbi:molecular chaperone [Pseudomonas zeae]|uniref:fimbrial biogenesis chaperone n=1 Tax=Pseudomonas zeae TaxID=2745510 RepID=UPI0039E0E1D0
MSTRYRSWAGHLLLLMCLVSATTLQKTDAGVMAESTRVIYLEGQKERTLMLANTNAYPVLVQVWTNHGEAELAPQQALTPLIVVPPVFRLQPGALQGLRLIMNGEHLPADRESVFWLNIYEVPPTLSKIPRPVPRVAVAMNTQMKVFYRPKAIATIPKDLPSALRFRLQASGERRCLSVHNSSPYHASFSSLKLVSEGNEQPVTPAQDMMTPPLSDRCYGLPQDGNINAADARVHFIFLDDSGHLQQEIATLQGH